MKKIAIILTFTLAFTTSNIFSNVIIEQSVTGTTRGISSNSSGLINLTITGYVLLAISATGTLVLTLATLRNMNNVEMAEQQVMHFLKANHTALTKDFSQSEGFFFQDLASLAGLTQGEADLLTQEFEGSNQQREFLEVLSGPIDGDISMQQLVSP